VGVPLLGAQAGIRDAKQEHRGLTPHFAAASYLQRGFLTKGETRLTIPLRLDPFVEWMVDYLSPRRLRVALMLHGCERSQDITNVATSDRSAIALLRPR
jgi:hypothetical protein